MTNPEPGRDMWWESDNPSAPDGPSSAVPVVVNGSQPVLGPDEAANHDGEVALDEHRSDGDGGPVQVSDGEAGMWRRPAGQASVSVDPEVLRSCGVALRRMGDGRMGSVAVTSTGRREGRTTIAIGLAAAAAAQGKRTILVDLDFLHRGIKDAVGAEAGPGVTEYLNGEASSDECVQPAGSHLEVVTAGVSSDNGVAGQMEDLAYLLTSLRAQCDVLVADLPQLEAGVVAAHMADLFDAVALVVRAGTVAMPAIEEAVSVLGHQPYVIFNAPRKRSLRRRLLGRKS